MHVTGNGDGVMSDEVPVLLPASLPCLLACWEASLAACLRGGRWTVEDTWLEGDVLRGMCG